MTTTTATMQTVPATQAVTALAAAPVGTPMLDRIAMRIGLALLLWGRHRAATPRAARPVRPTLTGDARWYMR